MPLTHTPLRSLVSFPSTKETYKLCVHEMHSALNISERSPGQPPGYTINSVEGGLLQLIIDTLGVNFDIYVPDDDGWGVPDENNVWTGCPGMIQRKEVDVAMAAMFQNYWSFKFSHQSFMYRDEGIYFVTKTPDFVQNRYAALLTFDACVWMLIFISILVLSLVYYFIMHKKFSFEDQLFSRFAELLLQEPIVKISRVASQEIIVLVWSIAVQFLTLSYMAVILTTIIAPKTEPPINNEDRVLDALSSGKYKAAIPHELAHFLHNLLSNSRPSFRKIGEMIKDNNWFFDINKSNYAEYLEKKFIVASAIYTYKSFNPLGNPIVISENPIYFARLCLLTQKEFPLKNKLDEILMRIFEAGLHEKLLEHNIFQRRLKGDLLYTTEEDWGVRVLALSNLQSAFYVLCLGHLMALVVLLIEILVDKYKEKSPGENDESVEVVDS